MSSKSWSFGLVFGTRLVPNCILRHPEEPGFFGFFLCVLPATTLRFLKVALQLPGRLIGQHILL